MSDLDQHLASIEDLLAGNTPPIFDENNPEKQLPEPEEAVLYKNPPGTRDGAMDLKPKIDMSKFAMPIFGQVDAQGNPVTKAPAPAPLAVLGGRNTPLMMNSSPPDQSEFGGGSGQIDGGSPATLRDVGGTSWNSPVTPGTWGTGDLPMRAPAPQGQDMISLLRGLFQGAL